MSDGVWIKIAGIDELGDNECRTVKAGDRLLALARSGTSYHALDNRCLHVGGPLGQGTVEGGYIHCPWHGRAYSLADGACMNVDERIAVYQTEIRDDGVYVKI